MKIEIESTYKDEMIKLQEEHDRQTERKVEVVRLETEKRFVEELRKVCSDEVTISLATYSDGCKTNTFFPFCFRHERSWEHNTKLKWQQ